MTHDDYCKLIGDQVVATYLRNQRIAELEAHVDTLATRVQQLEQERADQEALISKLSIEPTPSLSKGDPAEPQ